MSPSQSSAAPSQLYWSNALCWSVECSQPVFYSLAKDTMPQDLAQAQLALSSLLLDVMRRDSSNPTFKGPPQTAPEEVARVVLERERSSLANGLPTIEEQWLVRWAVLVLFEKESLTKTSAAPKTSPEKMITPTPEEIEKALHIGQNDIKFLLGRKVPLELITGVFRAFVTAKLHFDSSPDAPEFVRRLYEDPRSVR